MRGVNHSLESARIAFSLPELGCPFGGAEVSLMPSFAQAYQLTIVQRFGWLQVLEDGSSTKRPF